VYGAEIRLRCVGNGGGKVGVSQSLGQIGPTCAGADFNERDMQAPVHR
jgi:hypothetical protein